MDAPTRDAGFFTESLETRDPELFGSIANELTRQQDEIEMTVGESEEGGRLDSERHVIDAGSRRQGLRPVDFLGISVDAHYTCGPR